MVGAISGKTINILDLIRHINGKMEPISGENIKERPGE